MPPPVPPATPTPGTLLGQALRDDPARALLTFYDDATGERAELSVATFANWVAKTANFARDGLGLDVGDRVAIALPCHWQPLVWWQACWVAGLVVVPSRGGDGVPVSVLVRARSWPPDAPGAEPGPPGDEVVALGLGPMGLPVPGAALPPGAVDYDREIHAHGDRFVPPPGLSPSAPALESDGGVLSAGDLGDLVAATVRRWGLASEDRVLTTAAVQDASDAVAALLGPLSCGAGVVLARHLDLASDETLARRLRDEGVTAVTREIGSQGRFRLSAARHLD